MLPLLRDSAVAFQSLASLDNSLVLLKHKSGNVAVSRTPTCLGIDVQIWKNVWDVVGDDATRLKGSKYLTARSCA